METIAFVDGTVVVGDGRVLESATVIVKDNKISRVTKGSSPVPKKARRISLRGRSLLPGFIDCHVHLALDAAADPSFTVMMETLPMHVLRAAGFAERTLMAGVTTVRDMGSRNGIAIDLRNAVREGIAVGPRIIASGRAICITGGHGWEGGREVDGPDEMRKAVRDELKSGADFIKLMSTGGVLTPGVDPGSPQLTEEELRVGIQEAHNAGKKTATHAMGTRGIRNALLAGIDCIEHGVFLDEETIALMLEKDVPLVPTLSAPYHIQRKGVEAGIPEYAVEKSRRIGERHFESLRMAKAAGVTIGMGTDAGTPFNEHGENLQELKRLVDEGLTPMEAIAAGTGMAARIVGLGDIVGTIEAEKQADLIVVEGNPLEDIGSLCNPDVVVLVMRNGKVFKESIT